MSFVKKLLIAFFIFSVIASNNSFAQEPQKSAPPTKTVETPKAAEKPLEQAVEKDSNLQARKAQTKPACVCLQPAADLLNKAYGSIEEDEWTKAIKICKDSIVTIKNLEKTCKCSEISDYKKIIEAFLKYAEGGNHLDGAEDPNCPLALKLYADAIKMLDESIQKVSDEKIKSNAKNIKEYAVEEEQFVKDECQKT